MTAGGVLAWKDLDGDGIATATLNPSAGGGTPDDNSVTTSKIADGAIVDADINSAAGVAVSKLAPGTAAQVLTTTSGTAVWATPTVVERAFLFGKAGAIGATETNAADFPFIVPYAATMKRVKVVTATAASGAMTVQVRKAAAPGTAVPSYSDVTGFVATFANGSQIATFTLGTAVAVSEGDLLNFSAATGSGTNMMVEVVAT